MSAQVCMHADLPRLAGSMPTAGYDLAARMPRRQVC
jgi:hypothetical protein